ncbi:Fur family transcriptional regulator [Lentilactobacillus kisonensis]|uniref:Transcriptional regulator, Fur family n=2 Tax=Lentilactobacillus kisonensis TaxID=481722 RepID=H1LJ33_9LACO|nr:transcriptional repressor [Lentilactobacillus kisonensis]EHO49279.1 transcriptional regulator, Fur family [Lentilactobacillus kisonensis F0435]KRL23088.1 transcriptional regulator, Fur family [Lentilactobacillus kisonensis DSM 19906 = JCM 15041]
MPSAVKEATSVLKSNHFKITKQRMAMLEFLVNTATKKFVEVTSIDNFMRQTFPNMSHNTIYRNISEFAELGIVERQVQGDRASVKFQCDFEQEHHHHFICSNCGKVIELKDCPLSKEITDQLGGCKVTGHLFQIYGLCPECAQLNE